MKRPVVLGGVVAVAVAAACGSGGQASGGPDASSEAASGAGEGGADAHPEGASSDASHDGAAPDGSSDAAGVEGGTDAAIPPGWRAFSFVNHCTQTLWVGVLGNIVNPVKACQKDSDCGPQQACNPGPHQCAWASPGGGGWELDASATVTVPVPPSWGGRFWPRTGCSGFNANGVPACATGDCAGALGCAVGVGGTPPATLAELTVVVPPANDFYDVSNVDGANVPVAITPTPGTFDTNAAGVDPAYYCTVPGCTSGCGALGACPWNLASTCPAELADSVGGQYVGCRSANQACAVDPTNATLDCAGERDLYGCTPGGPNGVSGSCYSQGARSTCCGCPSWSTAGACNAHDAKWETPGLPEKYAAVFKTACPTAYSFPYDDPTSTFQCRGTSAQNTGYTVTFCP